MIVIYKSSIEIQNLNLKTLKAKINEIKELGEKYKRVSKE